MAPPRKRRRKQEVLATGEKTPAMLGWCLTWGKHTGKERCPKETETLVCSCKCHRPKKPRGKDAVSQ